MEQSPFDKLSSYPKIRNMIWKMVLTRKNGNIMNRSSYLPMLFRTSLAEPQGRALAITCRAIRNETLGMSTYLNEYMMIAVDMSLTRELPLEDGAAGIWCRKIKSMPKSLRPP